MNKARKGPAFLVIFLMLLLIVAYIYAAYQTVKPARGLICNGVFVETVNVGGMSEDEARTAVTQYRDEYLQRTVEVDVNGKTVSATLEQLGYNCEVGDVIAKAMQVGKDGNPFTNYAKIREIATTPLVYKLKYDAKEKKIRTFVNKKCKKKCAKAKNAKVKRENGTFVYTDAKEGSTIERMVDFKHGEYACTHYRRISITNTDPVYSLVALKLDTGRTHQIRVHMNYIGHPLPGDFLYNPDYSHISRQALHSHHLRFRHPITGEEMHFTAPVPEDMLL